MDGKKTKSRSTLEGIYRGKDIVNEILPRIIGVSFEEINQWIRCNKAFKTEKESPALWHIMCDAEVIRKNDLRFDENLSVGEDLSFFCTYLLYEQSVGYLDEYLYTYILRDGGANLQNQSNARKRIENKTKLISARLKLDELALQLYGADIHKYWEGTLVLSCIQAGLCMAKDKKWKHAKQLFIIQKNCQYRCGERCLHGFQTSKGLKSIPFRLLSKVWGGILYILFLLTPKRFLKGYRI